MTSLPSNSLLIGSFSFFASSRRRKPCAALARTLAVSASKPSKSSSPFRPAAPKEAVTEASNSFGLFRTMSSKLLGQKRRIFSGNGLLSSGRGYQFLSEFEDSINVIVIDMTDHKQIDRE